MRASTRDLPSSAGVPLRLLFASSLVTSAWAWWVFAWPILTGENIRHEPHYSLVFGHALGGSIMLLLGAVTLYVGWTRRGFRYHKLLGYSYLVGGGGGAALGLILSLRNPHHISGIAVATGTLAVVWLAVAGVAFRAAYNRRFDAHRQWMIRSYVLTWTFAAAESPGVRPRWRRLATPAVLPSCGCRGSCH